MSKTKRKLHTEDDFEIKKSTIKKAGKGLFARVKIREGDTIGEYTGKHLTDKESSLPEYVESRYLVWVCKDCWIWGEGELANYTRFINHSEEPNAELVTSTRWKKASIRALRKIKPGEEIFFNYGDEYWDVLNEKPKEE